MWTEKASYWEYLALVVSSKLYQGFPKAEESLNEELLESSIPNVGRVYLKTHYANWLLETGRGNEAWKLWDEVILDGPNHRLTASAYYWKGLFQFNSGDFEKAKFLLTNVRACLMPAPSLLSEWQLDAKAGIVLNRISAATDLKRYDDDFIERQKLAIKSDLRVSLLR